MFRFLVFATAVFLIICTKILTWFYQSITFFLAVNKIPGPVKYPLPTLNFLFMKVKPEDRLQWFCDLHNKFEKGIMMTTSSFAIANINIYKPHHLAVILSSKQNITKSFEYDHLETWLGKALLTGTGDKWFHERKIITPSFHFGILDQFTTVISEKAQILNWVIEEKIKANPGEPMEFFELSIRCALDIILETSIGVNMDIQRNHQTEYMSALHNVADISFKRLHYPWLKWDAVFFRTKIGSEFKSSVDTMTNFTMKIIEKKQQARKAISNSFTKKKDEFGKRSKKVFLDLMLDLNENEKNPMTDTELREQVDTFLFAGHDTTGVALSWTIFYLGNNPEMQEKVHEELNEVFGDTKESVTMKQIAELKYLDRVIKETLRLNPSVPGLGRVLTEEIELDGFVIPAGSKITLHVFTTHRDPEVWPDPSKFDPDRFLPENSKGRHPYAYVPFSAGPRNCIGQKFAMVELKIVLAAILRKWRVKSARTQAEMKMQSTFVLRPHGGNPIYFTPR